MVSLWTTSQLFASTEKKEEHERQGLTAIFDQHEKISKFKQKMKIRERIQKNVMLKTRHLNLKKEEFMTAAMMLTLSL